MKDSTVLLLMFLIVGTLDALSGTGNPVKKGDFGTFTKTQIQQIKTRALDIINNCQEKCENTWDPSLCSTGRTSQECLGTYKRAWIVDCSVSCTNKAFDSNTGVWEYRNVNAKCFYVRGDEQTSTGGSDIILRPNFELKADTNCEVGEAVIPRTDVFYSNVGAVFPSQLILCSGKVHRWKYYATRSAPFEALVLRPDHSDPTRWTIVGVNKIPASHVQPNQTSTFEVPPDDRISVLEGDVIGVAIISYGNTDNPQLHITQYAPQSATLDMLAQGFLYHSADMPTEGLKHGELVPKLTFSTRFSLDIKASLSADISEKPTDNNCKVGEDVIPRTDMFYSNFGAVFPSQLIPCSGKVHRWNFYATRSAPFEALVLRPDYSDLTRWTIVGVNQIPASYVKPNQTSTYEVPSGDRISVLEGDAIGVAIKSYSDTDNPQLHITQYAPRSATFDMLAQAFLYHPADTPTEGLIHGQLVPKLTFSTRFSLAIKTSLSADIFEKQTDPGDMICKLCLPDSTDCSLKGKFPGGV